MRIVFLTLKLDLAAGGGANRGLDVKLRGLQNLGHDVSLITIFPELNRLPDNLPYRVLTAPCADRTYPAVQRHVIATLRAHEASADVFHIDGSTCVWGGGMYRAEGGLVPTVAYIPTYTEAINLLTLEAPDPTKGLVPWLTFHVQVRLQWLKHFFWAKTVGLRAARKLDAVFGDSPILISHYVNFGFPAERMHVMPEFVDEERFRQTSVAPESVPASFGPQRPFRLLHAGRLLKMKGVDLLIRAIADLKKDGRNVTLTLVGDGPQRERLERLADQLGVREAITFDPWTDENGLPRAYAACDAFVHPCRFPEPFGRTVLEALFFDRPVVTTSGSGSEWVAGNAGIAVRMNSMVSLRDALADVYDNPSRLTACSAAAFERVRFFDHRAWTKKLADHLTVLVSSK